LLVDGGDFSEGQIYYNLGAGLETMRMMDYLGYDATVIGNHDWLNGPDVLIDAWKQANPKMALLSANVDPSDYKRKDEFNKVALPYIIKTVKGVRVAFIGVSTYEFIYDKFFKPVRILSPFSITQDLAERLKRKSADVVIAISHNSTKLNTELLQQAPDLDFVVGAHDHRKYIAPVQVKRDGAPAGWIVETGCWGRFLGRVDFEVTLRDPANHASSPSISLKQAKLLQVDERTPEHTETARRVEELERRIEAEMGPVFSTHVAHNEVEISRTGQENLMGNLATDAYLAGVQADFAVDQVNLIYGEFHPGDITVADVYNSNPAIFDPKTRKSWTLKLLDIEGKTLQWMMNVLLASKNIAESGIVSTSGMQVAFDPAFSVLAANTVDNGPIPPQLEAWLTPWLSNGPSAMEDAQAVVKEIRIAGQKLDPARKYRMAAGGGIIESLRFLNSVIPGTIPMGSLKDTGIEDWRLIESHLKNLKTVTADKIQLGNRVRTLQADVGILRDDIRWTVLGKTARGTLRARIQARISNNGFSPTQEGLKVQVIGHGNGIDETVERRSIPLAREAVLPAINPGQKASLEWEVEVPGDRNVYPLTVELQKSSGELNLSNNSATYYYVEN
jgi:5'-nucleotidase